MVQTHKDVLMEPEWDQRLRFLIKLEFAEGVRRPSAFELDAFYNGELSEEEADVCRLKIACHPEEVRIPLSARANVGKAKGMLKKYLKNAPVLPLEDMDGLIEKSVYEENLEALNNEGS